MFLGYEMSYVSVADLYERLQSSPHLENLARNPELRIPTICALYFMSGVDYCPPYTAVKPDVFWKHLPTALAIFQHEGETLQLCELDQVFLYSSSHDAASTCLPPHGAGACKSGGIVIRAGAVLDLYLVLHVVRNLSPVKEVLVVCTISHQWSPKRHHVRWCMV